MATVPYVAPAVEEEVDGRTITKRTSLKRTLSGNLVKFTEFIEDDNETVTNRVVESPQLQTTIIETSVTISSNSVLENLSDQLVANSPGPYVISAIPKDNTLMIFLNGQLLNDETTMTEDDEFIFINSFEEAIVAGSSLYVSYIPLEA